MAHRINRAIELLSQGQAIYYDGPHSGHVLTQGQGREDAGTWADYMNVGMEHGSFDMTGLAQYLRGMVDGGPDPLGPSHAGRHRRGAGERHRRGERAVQCLAVPSDIGARRAWHPDVPGGDRRCGAGIRRVLPLSASCGGCRSRNSFARSTHARRHAAGARRRWHGWASARAAAVRSRPRRRFGACHNRSICSSATPGR